MKTLSKRAVNVTNKPQTKTQLKRDLKKSFVKTFNRPNRLVDAYFEGEYNQQLFERLKPLKTNGIENYLYCFESQDTNKLTSFLIKVFDLPFFSKSLRGLTPQIFMDVLIDLCTIKDGQTKKLTLRRQSEPYEIVSSVFPFEKDGTHLREDEYQILVSFDAKIIDLIFQAYI